MKLFIGNVQYNKKKIFRFQKRHTFISKKQSVQNTSYIVLVSIVQFFYSSIAECQLPHPVHTAPDTGR